MEGKWRFINCHGDSPHGEAPGLQVSDYYSLQVGSSSLNYRKQIQLSCSNSDCTWIHGYISCERSGSLTAAGLSTGKCNWQDENNQVDSHGAKIQWQLELPVRECSNFWQQIGDSSLSEDAELSTNHLTVV